MNTIEQLRKQRPPSIDAAAWEAALTKLETGEGDAIAKISKGVTMNIEISRSIAKGMADAIEARPDAYDAVTIKRYLNDLAKAEQQPFETTDRAFARVAQEHEIGKRLMLALSNRKRATGESDYTPPPPAASTPANSHSTIMDELVEQHIAGSPQLQKLRAADPSRAKARGLMEVLRTPAGQRVWQKHRAEQISA